MKSGSVPPAWSTRQRLAFTKRAGQLNQQLFGANNIQLPLRWRTSAELSRDDCRFADGERFLRQALAVQEKLLGPKSPIIADTLADLGECLYLEDKDTDAESILHRSGALYRASGNPGMAAVDNYLAQAFERSGKETEAIGLLREAADVTRRADGENFLYSAVCCTTSPVRSWLSAIM